MSVIVLQGLILAVFIGEFIAMTLFGLDVVPKDPNTKEYFVALHGVLLTILNVPALSQLIQRKNQKGDDNEKVPTADTPPAP